MSPERKIVAESAELSRTLTRMTHEIVEKCPNINGVVLLGIRSRGVYLARRIARKIYEMKGTFPPVGVLDISPYRDDRPRAPAKAGVVPPESPVAVNDKSAVLVDDVIYRGRTMRAAMEALERLGRPQKVFVAVLVDRGARELPIRADIVGKNLQVGEDERINVLLEETDGIDQITVARW